MGRVFPSGCCWLQTPRDYRHVRFGAFEAFDKKAEGAFDQFDFLATHMVAPDEHACAAFDRETHPVNIVFCHFHCATCTQVGPHYIHTAGSNYAEKQFDSS